MESVWFSKPKAGGGQHLGLSREVIVRKAVEMLDEHGMAKLSMRKLAAELGAAPMSLYWHVPTKDALLELCLDAAYGELEPPDEGVDWETAMRGMMHSLRHLALRHPWWVRTIGQFKSVGPNAVAMAESMLVPMRNTGLPLFEASMALSAMSSFVIGFALAEVNFGQDGQVKVDPDEAAKFAELYREKHPGYVELLDQVELHSLDAQFEFGLDCVINGVKAKVGALRA